MRRRGVELLILILLASSAALVPARPAHAAVGDISTVAGNGESGFSGDGGPATSASLQAPLGIAVDNAGNTYIADRDNQRVRKVNASGIITTVAGNGTQGFSGDGGSATSASLNIPWGVAADADGNFYIADTYNYRVRKVDTSGVITTLAGNGVYGYSGDGGPATSASLRETYDIAVDSSGNFYLADEGNHRVRKVDPSGVITTVAGNGVYGYSGDGGPATGASLASDLGVAVDDSGNIYIADRQYTGESRVRKVDTSGTITTVAGNGTASYSGDGGPATSAGLSYISDVALDNSGSLFIADSGNNRIRRVDTLGVISTFAGNGAYDFSGDGGPATSASLRFPWGVAVDAQGNVFIGDSGNQRVRRVEGSGSVTSEGPPGDPTCGDSVDNDLDGYTDGADPDCQSNPPTLRYVAFGDSVSYGHGLANPSQSDRPCNDRGMPACTLGPNQGPSVLAFPSLLASRLGLTMSVRNSSCTLTDDQLAISGAPSIIKNNYAIGADGSVDFSRVTAHDNDCDPTEPIELKRPHRAIFEDEFSVANLVADPPRLVSLLAGANDIRFADCFMGELARFGFYGVNLVAQGLTEVRPHNCLRDSPQYKGLTELEARLGILSEGLTKILNALNGVRQSAPEMRVVLLTYYQPIPPPEATLTASDPLCKALAYKGITKSGYVEQFRKRQAFFQHAVNINARLNNTIIEVASRYPWVRLVSLAGAFAGHELCTQDPYVYSLTNTSTYAWWRIIHPNATGQRVLADAIEQACFVLNCLT